MIKNMMMMKILLLAGLALLFGCHPSTPVPEKPNIILILADDLGTGDVGCYNPASKIPTPGMDQIALQGVRFTDAHTGAAVCTPTRYGILTGRYCWRTRLKRGVLNGFGKHLMEPGRETIASMLQQNGYHTACIGKWHLGMDFKMDGEDVVDYNGKIDFSPNVFGFDYFYGIAASLDFPPYIYIENERFTQIPTEIYPGQGFPRYLREGEKAADFDFETAWEVLLNKAMDIIDNRPANQPFFLYFALPSPHKPVWPDRRFAGKTPMGPYGDFVHQTDHIIQQVLEKLSTESIEKNTLLIVTSDNGSFMHRLDATMSADHLGDETVQGYYPETHEANFRYRGTKADIWEAGHRVPFMVQWPGIIKPGLVKDQTICTTDFMATFADLLNVTLGEDIGEDSFSFMPLLFDRDENFTRAPVVNHSSAGMFAIRRGRYKLVLGNGSGGRQHPRGRAWEGPFMLFDLDSDIYETNNIIEQNQELANSMENELRLIIESGTSNIQVSD